MKGCYKFNLLDSLPDDLRSAGIVRTPNVPAGSSFQTGWNVLVTGAGQLIGIGSGAARGMAEYFGAKRVILGYGRQVSQVVVDSIAERGAEVFPVSMDLSKPGNVPTIVEEVRKCLFGESLDMVIHVAGVTDTRPLAQLQAEDLSRSATINAITPLLLARDLRPLMAEQSSQLFVGTNHQRATGSIFGLYAPAKCMLEGGMRVLAAEVAPHQLVNMLIVNWALSERQIQGHKNRLFNLVDEARKNPTLRINTGEEVAVRAFAYHVTNSTGSVDIMDGGLASVLGVNA
jgi:NAD(P)-dependent dehydrogenase (short-subunit alcohol dehydrogenase family)